MELSAAVGEAYAALAAQLGHSEISKFGENVIEKMYRKYRTNDDPLQGLSLWEFNNYLHSTGSFTLYDMKEYKIIMNMLGLLVDRYANAWQCSSTFAVDVWTIRFTLIRFHTYITHSTHQYIQYIKFRLPLSYQHYTYK